MPRGSSPRGACRPLRGTAPPPRLALSIADRGDFGHVCVGVFRDEPLTLMNGGACPLTISNITSSAPDFLVPEVVTYPIVVAAGGSAEVEIRFQPTSFGSKSATLTVTSDDPVGPRTLTLSGTAPSGHLVITGSGHFGSVELGQRAERTVSICNDGECDLHVSRAAFKPDPWKPGCRDCDDCDCDDDEREEDRSDQCCATFKIVNNPFPATVKGGACLGVLIRFIPTCDGRKLRTRHRERRPPAPAEDHLRDRAPSQDAAVRPQVLGRRRTAPAARGA